MNVLNKCEDVLRRLFKVCGFFLTKKCSPKTNRKEFLEVDLQVFFNVLYQITKEPHHFPIFLDFYRMRVFLIFLQILIVFFIQISKGALLRIYLPISYQCSHFILTLQYFVV